jgi:hypothetical protein
VELLMHLQAMGRLCLLLACVGLQLHQSCVQPCTTQCMCVGMKRMASHTH